MNQPLVPQFTSASGAPWSFRLEDLALVIYNERLEKGLTQEALANQLGIATRTVKRLESIRNNNAPSVAILVKISNLFGLSSSEFMQKVSDMAQLDKSAFISKTTRVPKKIKDADRFKKAIIDLLALIK